MENKIENWVKSNSSSLSLRFKRFLAMYFPNANIRRQFWIETNVKLGDQTYLNPSVVVVDDYQSGEVLLDIGKNCSIAPGVVFAPCSLHNNSKILRDSGILTAYELRKKIIVGDDVWIGANCTVAPGINIGSCSIIGANSFVNMDIPPYSLAYGSPIKIIKNIKPKFNNQTK